MKYLLLLLTLPVLVQARIISTTPQPIVVTNTEGIKRVCYFNDKSYSLGAIIQVGEHYIECSPEQDFENNGALKWQSKSKASSPSKNKITINKK